ncbi:RagB/SusD family nutrient uptake outer membrane protein [Chryseobacterium joostei]|uniref:RagB/SusD family nutrient uptake outer membrane protein n=1 Tax=Chryseobacterium joostei TaxID=112234 RepID=A0A1N7HTI0_9FLAO|nr:RagB/SusD family nutrient uptake outer membrane protein [Chryseobacterium joostei]AZA99161.1 RagB/SusD family nutrient uptake outer membrane protein [Chryseobacterium joostei]SIS28123.1 SusD family protein [Chryseobacterium joostei]
MKTILKTLLIFTSFFLSGCSKEWLEEKQDIKLIVPTTLSDLDLLMNTSIFSYDGRGSMEASCDDIEITLEQYNSLWYDFDRKLVTWTVDEFPKLDGGYTDEWDYAYSQVQSCNVALQSLEKISRTESNGILYDRIKGTALYHRSRAFLNLAMTFCKYYNKATAETDLGIPLKLDQDINTPIFRSSLGQTYQRIIDDLTIAASLLPRNAISPMHITNAGAYGLLARTYLFMNDYQHALETAEKSLRLYSILDDYNTFNPAASYPLAFNSKEVHIQLQLANPYSSISGLSSQIPFEIYSLYDENDLRKILYFKIVNGKPVWRGDLLSNQLAATATDEIMLIGAECAARLGDKDGAVALLNSLLKTRFKTGTFVPLSANTDIEVLDLVLIERRKELLKRGLRFQDLKRLNKETRYAKALTRIVGENIYTLPPNDKRYVLPIPQYIINYNGLEQN